jgi:hypothetical protein
VALAKPAMIAHLVSPLTMSELKLRFLSTRAARPSYRYRVEQMLPYLTRAGHECHVRFIPGNIVSRLILYRDLPLFDIVFLQKRLLSPVELVLVRRWSKRLVFDVDDAVMFNRAGGVERRRPGRFKAMVRATDLIICGNHYLADQAKKLGSQTVVVPTAIDTDRFREGLKPVASPKIVVGWTGSRGSTRYLNQIFPILARLNGNVELKIIADSTSDLDFKALGSLPYRFVEWSAATEVHETAEFDIGLMPLPDDNLARGKCGCKALQYLALGSPPYAVRSV